MTIVELELYSPRWGHNDTYKVELHQDYMEISTMQQRRCKATWVQDCDPEWSGEDLEKILRNDSIYPPAVTRNLFERAWKGWRGGELSDEQVSKEIILIGDWINTVTKSKPNSDFWNMYF